MNDVYSSAYSVEFLAVALAVYSACLVVLLSRQPKEILKLLSPADLKWMGYLAYAMTISLLLEGINVYGSELFNYNLTEKFSEIVKITIVSKILLIIILSILLVKIGSKISFLGKVGDYQRLKKTHDGFNSD